MKKNLLVVIFFALLSAQAYSEQLQGSEIFAVHPKFGFVVNLHSANFSNFQGSADCGLFKSGAGFGASGGLFFERKLNDISFIGLGLGFADRSAMLTIENSFPARDINNQITNAKLNNNLDVSLSYFEIQPDYRYTLTDNFINGPLRLVGAFRVAFPISHTFTQDEEISSPAGAVFIDNNGNRRKIRDIANGDISSINSMAYGLSIGCDNLLKIGDNSYFSQQLLFDLNLNDITSDATWKAMGIRLELGLRYSLISKPEAPKAAPTPPPPAEIDIFVEEPPAKTISLKRDSFMGKLISGNELLATSPLVNAVFFKRGEFAIPPQYSDKMPREEDLFGGDALSLHSNVLPRIATIVKNNPNSAIVLEASTSGAEYEPEGIELARNRAKAVKERLISLGVPENKISESPRISPRYPSNQDFTEGVDENQRVDIIVKNAPLQEYVDIQKYREIDGKFALNLDYQNYPVGAKASISTSFDKDSKAVERGKIEMPIKQRIDEDTELYTLDYIVSIGSDTYTQKDSLYVSKLAKETIQLNLENFEAVLRFDYNSSALSDDNKGLLKQLAEKLPEGSVIQILGSADALGTQERNIKLSKERADNTELFIKSVAGNKFKIETGINQDKFNETTPQGRFLNRAIRIKVKK